jgi:hypothetical protein
VTVKRYRDVSEMPSSSYGDPSDPNTYARIKQLWQFSERVVSLPLFRPGVYRYRSIEEMQAARDRATIERMRALRALRARRKDSR